MDGFRNLGMIVGVVTRLRGPDNGLDHFWDKGMDLPLRFDE